MVIPAYYDITLKGKAMRDNDSAEMLDIIRAGLRPDFVSEYATQNGGCGRVLRDCIAYGKGEVTSYVASNLNAFEENLAKFLEAYND